MTNHHSDVSSRRNCSKDSYLISTLKINKTSKGWTVPCEAEYMKILLIGGGGSGASSSGSNRGAGGGGAGTYTSKDFCVSPYDTFNVTIGQGGTDGKDGENSVLEYRSCIKTAYGGKAGVGTVGGKGGKGYHSNENGTDGKSTGEGGKAKTYKCYDVIYGNGGEGGIIPTLSPAIKPHVVDVKQELEKLFSIRQPMPLIVPKGSPRHCHSPRDKFCKPRESPKHCHSPKDKCCKPKKEECRCIPNIVVPPLTEVGNPGVQGYCEIEFYSRKPLCCDTEKKCDIKVQNITIKSPDVEYAINPEADTVVINTSNFEGNLYLPKGLCPGAQIHIELLHSQGLNANIYTETGGMFTLSATMPKVVLLFNGCTWSVLDSHNDVASFYPTTQECKATRIIDVIGNNYSLYAGRIVTNVDGTVIAATQFFSSNSLHIFERCDNCIKPIQIIDISISNMSLIINSLAISGDGKTIVFSVYDNISGVPEIFIYTKGDDCKYSKTTTITQPVGLDEIDFFAVNLDISVDGNVLVVVSVGGRILIYKKTNNIWALSESIVSAGSGFLHVAVNADGTIFTVGDGNGNYLKVFVYQYGNWIEEYGINSSYGGPYIHALDISADGNTIVWSRPVANEAIILQRTSGIWDIQQSIPTISGYPVSISADGNTMVSGNYTSENSPKVWTRIGTSWSLKAELIDPVTYPGEYVQHYDVVLTSSGGILFTINYASQFFGGYPLIRMYK